MKKKLRIALIALLALVFITSAAMLIHENIQYQEGEETYAEAESLVELPDLSALPTPVLEGAPPAEEAPSAGEEPPAARPVYVDPYADALRSMDFTALREVNPDVLGWILIPGTAVSYPMVQGEDNQYYLNHTWKKWNSVVGSIFLECNNSADLSDFNTLVYGHRMNNGSMFASLKNYKRQSYWEAHPCVYLTDDSGSHKYEIFAAYEVSTQGETYRLGFSGDEAKQSFLDYCQDLSVISTGITPTVYDRVLTLSTCTGNGHATRWVVQAVERGVAPAQSAEETPAKAPVEAPAQLPGEPPADPPAEPPAEAPAEIPPEQGGQTADAPAADGNGEGLL